MSFGSQAIFAERYRLIEEWNTASESFFYTFSPKLLNTMRHDLSAARCSILNGLLICTKNVKYSEMPRLTSRGNEHKLRNVAKEYIAFFLYKAPPKGITLQENEEAFELDGFFLQHWENALTRGLRGLISLEEIEKNCNFCVIENKILCNRKKANRKNRKKNLLHGGTLYYNTCSPILEN